MELRVVKKEGKRVKAYRLGDGGPVLEALERRGLIRRRADGRWEIFSREAVNGSGQLAETGDYVKLDGEGRPYPNAAAWFAANHRPLEGDEYEQVTKPLEAWTPAEPVSDAVRFLMEERGLVLDPAHPDRFFSAPLWGTLESAPRDAVLVFYRVERDGEGRVTDAEYNFVARPEFRRSYRVCGKKEEQR